jgi:hypothetical protein
MATITDYASLVTAVTEYLAREEDTTLVARIPSFIQLTESKLNRGLFVRQMEVRATASVDTATDEPEFITLPDDFQSMRRVRLPGVLGKPRLQFLSGTQMDEVRTTRGNVVGMPENFTIVGTEMELCRTPSENFEIEMVYRANIPALTASNTTNWLLTLAPDVYLYGALLESAPYIKEDGRLQVWGAGFSAAVDGLNRLGAISAFNAGPLTVRVSGVTP